MKLALIQTTCHDESEARKIARVLIEQSLAACVQMTPIESFYKWKGEFCNDKEVLLNIKTKMKNFEKVKSKIKELHSYDVPEIICIEIEKSSKEYKEFINKNC